MIKRLNIFPAKAPSQASERAVLFSRLSLTKSDLKFAPSKSAETESRGGGGGGGGQPDRSVALS